MTKSSYLTSVSILLLKSLLGIIEAICYNSVILELIKERNLVLGLTQENSIENSI